MGQAVAIDPAVTRAAMAKMKDEDKVMVTKQVAGDVWRQEDFFCRGHRHTRACPLCGLQGPLDDSHTAWRCSHPAVEEARAGADGARVLDGVDPDHLPKAILAGWALPQTVVPTGPFWGVPAQPHPPTAEGV